MIRPAANQNRGLESMTSIDQNLGAETLEAARDAWVKPEIASYAPVAATQANTLNPGDTLESNS